jgi:ElaB/YqjD/DUF883 family membrane-anchored ribosome-binding protein
MSNHEPDRFIYSEKRTINVGQYENIEVFCSISSNLKKFNLVDKTVEIFHSESAAIDEEKEAFVETAKKTMERVRKILNVRESKIRKASQTYVDFPAENKFKDLSVYKDD